MTLIKSDGGATSYYQLPPDATELGHLMSYKSMSYYRASIFKACYRLGEKAGTEIEYDLNKIEHAVSMLRRQLARGEQV
jgi:hypothetical protein